MIVLRVIDINKFIGDIVGSMRYFLVTKPISTSIYVRYKGKVLISRPKKLPVSTIVIGVFIIINSYRQLFIYCNAVIFHHGICIRCISPVCSYLNTPTIAIKCRILY